MEVLHYRMFGLQILQPCLKLCRY